MMENEHVEALRKVHSFISDEVGLDLKQVSAAADYIAKLERELESRPAVPQPIQESMAKWTKSVDERCAKMTAPTVPQEIRELVVKWSVASYELRVVGLVEQARLTQTHSEQLAGAIAKAEGDGGENDE